MRRAHTLATALVCCAAVGWPAALAADSDPAACARLDRNEVLLAVNTARARGGPCGGLGAFKPSVALAWHADLAEAAHRQASWIAERGELLHVGPRGEVLAERARAAGYAFRRVNENLALGQHSIGETVADWLQSEGHCANLLDPTVTEFGLALACTREGNKVWVMVSGRR
jgi:uncharacterized protein YkwD